MPILIPEQIVDEIDKLKSDRLINWITITGGEPAEHNISKFN